jgi:hypothetical protein
MSTIPLVVHQVWVQGGRDSMPPHIRRMTEWTEQLTRQAGGEYRLWQERDLRADLEASGAAELYRSAPSHAARSDILRLLVLKLHGGFYLDTDMLLLRPENLGWITAPSTDGRVPQLVLPFLRDADGDWMNFNLVVINNCFMAAPKGSALVGAILEHMSGRGEPFDPDKHSEFGWTLSTTGPSMIARVVLGDDCNLHHARLLPKSVVRQQEVISADAVLADLPDAAKADVIRTLRELHPTTTAVHGQERSWFGAGSRSVSDVVKGVQRFAASNATLLLIIAAVATVAAVAAAVGWNRAVSARLRKQGLQRPKKASRS